MADPNWIFHPFRGVRYAQLGRSDLSELISPPYDIISEQRQAELYSRNEHNFVRVELARAEAEARYERAAGTLRRWLAEGVLARETHPCFYLLTQEFSIGGRQWVRRGVFGLVRLPEEGERFVLSHEGTLAGPKADRLKLMRACKAMTSPIMLMLEDRERRLLELLRGGLDLHVGGMTAVDDDGVTHRISSLTDPVALKQLGEAVGTGPLYIADGHHRFETAVAYRDEMRARYPKAPPTAGFNYALALVNSAQDDGLRIFPTHRLIAGLDERAMRELRQCMEEWFEVEERPVRSQGAVDLSWLEGTRSDDHVLGAYLRQSGLLRLVAKRKALPRSGGVVERLDVSILHRLLVDPALAGSGCSPDSEGRVSHDSHAAGPAARGPRLTYTTDATEAVAAVDRGDYDVAFFLRPTRVADVIAAARGGERMPGKSTYFYPKIPAGLVVSDASEEPI
ncbi:MAG: DUF1015 domain-containing protein [Armatimonadota bacterium]